MSIKHKICIDLESLPDQRPGAFDRYLELVEPPANYKKQETIDNWMLENAEAKAEEKYCKSGLSGLFGEICTIGFAVDDRDAVILQRDANISEHALLHDFSIHMADLRVEGEGDHVRIEWIGHNLLGFDLRFLKQRYLVNRIPPGFLIPADARHDNGTVFDTMKEWAGFRDFVKQDELCEALGLPTKPGMTGADVWPAWKAGEFEKIREYNLYDVNTVRDIYRIMTGEF